jgi:hypothetical protein
MIFVVFMNKLRYLKKIRIEAGSSGRHSDIAILTQKRTFAGFQPG